MIIPPVNTQTILIAGAAILLSANAAVNLYKDRKLKSHEATIASYEDLLNGKDAAILSLRRRLEEEKRISEIQLGALLAADKELRKQTVISKQREELLISEIKKVSSKNETFAKCATMSVPIDLVNILYGLPDKDGDTGSSSRKNSVHHTPNISGTEL